MKKIFLVLSVIALLSIAAELPPQLPSSFYGYITPQQSAGTFVNAWVGGVRVAQAQVQFYEGSTVYAIDVPCNEGALITFKIRGKVYGKATCHIGTNTWLDLAPLTAKR